MPNNTIVRIALSSLLVVATSAWAAPLLAANMNKFLQQGIAAFNQGHYTEAIGLFGAAKQSESDNPVLHYYMANALVKVNQKKDAIREYKLAMVLQPDGQIAKYAETALQALGALPRTTNASAAIAPPPGTGRGGGSAIAPQLSLSSTKEDIPNTQQPQVVSIVDESPESHRVDLIVTNLQSMYGDIVMFRRSSKSNPDERTTDMLKRYSIGHVPAIILINDQGQAFQQFYGNFVEENVRSKVEELARTSRWKEPGVSQDPHLVEYRHQVLTELEARIASDQVRLDREIEQIKASTKQQLADLRASAFGAYGYNLGDESTRLTTEEDKKIQALRADFEKRKTEWRAAAQAKIDARRR